MSFGAHLYPFQLGTYLEVELLGHGVIPAQLHQILQIASQSSCANFHFHLGCVSSSSASSSSTLGFIKFCFVLFLAQSGCPVVSHCGFELHCPEGS